MIVWGGGNGRARLLNTGGPLRPGDRHLDDYDPDADVQLDARDDRLGRSTGSVGTDSTSGSDLDGAQMIVWGGVGRGPADVP